MSGFAKNSKDSSMPRTGSSMPTPTPPKRRGLWSYLFGKSPAIPARSVEDDARKLAASRADNASPVHSRTSSACYVPELVGAESLVFKSLILTQSHATALMVHLPESLQMQNFKLAYSMLNDGSDVSSFYKKARPHKNSILLIQTTDGTEFGCFTASAWHEESSYYGTGVSLMFRFKHQSADDIDVYKWTGRNTLFQYSTDAKIAIGGGGDGFGIVLEKDFSSCASYSCDTYGNTASLASLEADLTATCGVSNVELWSFQL
jgi:hypothetical protein